MLKSRKSPFKNDLDIPLKNNVEATARKVQVKDQERHNGAGS
jgi:hypothetical protein